MSTPAALKRSTIFCPAVFTSESEARRMSFIMEGGSRVFMSIPLRAVMSVRTLLDADIHTLRLEQLKKVHDSQQSIRLVSYLLEHGCVLESCNSRVWILGCLSSHRSVQLATLSEHNWCPVTSSMCSRVYKLTQHDWRSLNERKQRWDVKAERARVQGRPER
jgi:hypothetical protein